MLHVVVLTPLGLGGRGGIDRLMDELNSVLGKRSGLRIKVCYRKTRGEGPLLNSAGLMLKVMVELVARKLTGRINVAHINLAHSGSIYRKMILGWACRMMNIPYIVHLHGSRFRQTWDGAPKWISRALERFFNCSAYTLVLGTVWAQYIAQKAPLVAGRILIFPTATSDQVTLAHKAAPGHMLNILFSGRHGSRKGVPQLVAALGKLAEDANWHADLTGDGEIEKTRLAVKKLGIEDKVSVPGWVTAETHAVLLANADIVVLPSFDENLPLSIVEAFSRRIAVVSTPVGAVSDIVIDGISGLLVQPGDVEGLADALRKLLRDVELRDRLAKGGRQVFETRLNIKTYTDQLIEVWRNAANGN